MHTAAIRRDAHRRDQAMPWAPDNSALRFGVSPVRDRFSTNSDPPCSRHSIVSSSLGVDESGARYPRRVMQESGGTGIILREESDTARIAAPMAIIPRLLRLFAYRNSLIGTAMISRGVVDKGTTMAAKRKVASRKVERAMHEMKRGELHSGRSGKVVRSRKQAIAIGLSEARKAGARIPRKKSAGKKH